MRPPLMLFVAGAAAGISFVIACSQMSAGTDANATPTDTNAAPSDCATWQIAMMNPLGTPANGVFEPGWEPFAVSGTGSGGAAYVWARRCAP